MRVVAFLLLILLSTTSAFASNCKDCHVEAFVPSHLVLNVSKQYLNVREATNNNDDKTIHVWQKQCGASNSDPYCQAAVNSWFKETYLTYGDGKKSPWPMYASVARTAEYCNKNSLTFKVISTKKLTWGIEKAEEGDLASWQHGKAQWTSFGYKGHAGIVRYSDPKTKIIYTREANTKAGPGGDQSGTVKGDMTDGHEGVYDRQRTIDLYSNFPIKYFIRVK